MKSSTLAPSVTADVNSFIPIGTFVQFPDSPFELFQPYPPAGDQPAAIAQLCEGIAEGEAFQTLLGVTGSGKTIVFGLLKRGDCVYTEIVQNASKATLQTIIRGKFDPNSLIHTDGW